MKLKDNVLWCLCLVIILTAAGCGLKTEKAQPKAAVQTSEAVNTNDKTQHGKTNGTASSAAKYEGEEKDGTVTPYQLLNLMAGNAEEISFEYKLFLHETGDRETGSFYKSGEFSAQVFTTKDMKGRPVIVRQVEREGRVFYIMESAKKMTSYPAPAEDLLLYKMMKAASEAPKKSYKKDRFRIFEYSLPFIQDDAIRLTYRFFIQDNALKRLEYIVDNTLSKTYEFSDFEQEVKDKKVFILPEGYAETAYDYNFSDEDVPPWWENDGLSD